MTSNGNPGRNSQQSGSTDGAPPAATVVGGTGRIADEPGVTIIGGDTLDAKPASPGATVIAPAAAAKGADNLASVTHVLASNQTNELHGGTGTAATFISSPANGGDPAATMIGAPEKNKDMEDYFDTLVEDGEDAGPGKQKNAGFVIGDHLVVGELGRGGMGVVYKARHRKLNRLVALKMILAGKHSGNEALKRFMAEAQAVAQLQHPGIVQVFEINEHEGLPYFSLEFVDGTDLHRDLNGQPRDARRSAEMVEQLCTAMQYAHDHKILHRDLKPANVLLTKDGKPKITDFGLAKQVDEDASGQTSDGTIMGSPSYMPPEQARGELSSITPRSDLYSLGAILYQMLTGRPPFITDRPLDTVMQVVSNEPVQPRDLQPGIPVDLETICMKALQKNPEQRYENCAALAADLRRFLNGEPILARPVSRLERVWRWCKRNPKIAVPSGVAGFFITATALIASWAWNETSALATSLKDERDTVTEQKAEVERQKEEVEVQRDEATKQRGIAIANAEQAEKEKEEANRQRILADEAKLQAEKNQKLAESQALLALKNIQLIVTDVDKMLADQPGTDEIRIGLLQLVEKKWDELDVALAGGIQGQAIPTQMMVRANIAAAFMDLDKIVEADAQYQKIYRQAEERVLVKNRNDASRYNLAKISLQWSGVKSRLSGNPVDAEPLQEKAIELIREILLEPHPEPGSPSKLEIVDALQSTLLRRAHSLMKKGRLAEANAAFAEVEEWNQTLLDESLADAEWWKSIPEARRDFVTSYLTQNVDLARAGRANVLCRLGRVDEAILVYESVMARIRSMVAAIPGDTNAKDQVATQARNYGQYMLRAGRADAAARLLAESLEHAEVLFNADSKNTQRKRDYGHSLYYLGTARDAQELADDALVLFERARVVRAELVEGTPDKANRVNLMLAEARLGNNVAAQTLADDLGKSDALDPDLRIDVARAYSQLVRRAAEAERSAFADKAFDALERCISDGMSDPFAIETESDLIPIREDPRFPLVIEQLTAVRDSFVIMP